MTLCTTHLFLIRHTINHGSWIYYMYAQTENVYNNKNMIITNHICTYVYIYIYIYICIYIYIYIYIMYRWGYTFYLSQNMDTISNFGCKKFTFYHISCCNFRSIHKCFFYRITSSVHFGCPKITFDKISCHCRLIHKFF